MILILRNNDKDKWWQVFDKNGVPEKVRRRQGFYRHDYPLLPVLTINSKVVDEAVSNFSFHWGIVRFWTHDYFVLDLNIEVSEDFFGFRLRLPYCALRVGGEGVKWFWRLTRRP